MQVLLDADGLIKLNRAGILQHVTEAYDCIIPTAVYEEVVIEGKARQYEDAETIEALLAHGAQVVPVHGRIQPGAGLGAGERAILGLLQDAPEAVVVSDDRRFLTVLSAQGFPFLTPADMLVTLGRDGQLGGREARDALERLRPVIRTMAYYDALADLDAKEDGRHEED